MIFCTLFNWAYLAQGVALYNSLQRTRGGDFTLYVLCMDDITAEYLMVLALPNLRVVSLSEIEDETLLTVKAQRTVGEYCWTCTSPLVIHVQSLYPENTLVTYVDADIAFFADPKLIEEELGNGSIFVHEHAFASEFEHLEALSGRFNVGVTAFRNDAEGRACLARWRRQCIDECVMDPAAGKCGDQNYLDEWPDLYPKLVISRSRGVGLAPWNITKCPITMDANGIWIDGTQAVFYHFHGLRLLRPRFFVRPTLVVTGAYRLPPPALDAFYRPYSGELWRTVKKFPLIISNLQPLPDLSRRMGDDQVLFSWMGRFLPIGRNAEIMAYLYGFDSARQPNQPAETA